MQSQATASPTAIQVAGERATQQRDKYERLKADVRVSIISASLESGQSLVLQVKLRLLEENRVQVMTKQLEKLQGALAAYFSGNAELLASSVAELCSLSVPTSSLLL